MGHMKQNTSEVRSTTTKKKQGGTNKTLHILERDAASLNAMEVLPQEPQNRTSLHVFMTVKPADSFIASNQTGAFPRVSNRGNKYICVLYVYGPTFIKDTAIKSRHRSELLGACKKVYAWRKSRGFKPKLHRMDNETSSKIEEFIKTQNTDLKYSAPGRHCDPTESYNVSLLPTTHLTSNSKTIKLPSR